MYWEGRNNDHNKFHITKFFLASFLLVLAVSVQNARSEDFSYGSDAATLANNCQLDNVLQSLLTPEELGSIQVRALRQELLKILNSQAIHESIDLPDYDLLSDGKLLYDEPVLEDKRSIASLAKSGQFPYESKRKLSSIARSGYHFGYTNKRSIANLAKNGQLPTLQSPQEEESNEEEKRSVASLARSGAINRYFKRGIESLVRSGYMPGKRYNDIYENENKKNVGSLARNGYMKREINDFLGDLYEKRYIGSLAKQYNFPSGKRNVGALARNGELYRFNRHNTDNSFDYDKRNVQSLMRNNAFYAGKRNIASVARNQNLPLYNRYEEYKRNIGAMARDWALPNHSTTWDHQEDEKRNVAALLRQDSYLHSVNRNSAVDAHPTPELGDEHQSEDKRNLASLKAQATSGYYSNRNMKRSVPLNDGNDKNDNGEVSKDHERKGRQKRQADDYFAVNSDEYPVPVMQNTNGFDYDDLVQALAERYPNNEKRFLGSVAKGGWFRSDGGGQVRFNPVKRHIGSLARLGWLPSFRYARSRFGRSGRSVLPPLSPERLEREHSTLADGRLRQDFFDGTSSYFELPSDIAYIPPTPVPFISHASRGDRVTARNNDPALLRDQESLSLAQELLSDDEFLSQYFGSPNYAAAPKYTQNSMTGQGFEGNNFSPVTYGPEKRYLLLPAVDNILLRRLYSSYATTGKVKSQ